MIGLKKSDAVNKKKKFEADFLKLTESDPAKKEKYFNLFKQFEKAFGDYAPLSKQYDYYSECLMGVDGFRMAAGISNVMLELKKKQAGKDNKFATLSKEGMPSLPFKNYNKATDKKLCLTMLQIYLNEVDRSLMPIYLDSLFKVYKNNVADLTDYLYQNSNMLDNEKAKNLYSDVEKNAGLIEKDPMYQLALAINQHYQKAVVPQTAYLEKQIAQLQKEYMLSLKENIKTKKFYPDANGTLRVAYGKVSDYDGKDGIHYKHYTTMDGLIEKNQTGEEDFYVKQRLIELYNKKDFGQYADKNGQLRTAFIASNHTTGGNSGSPVLNAKGELIGTNFDRNWEGTMSDVMYNVSFCRNITLDVRYTLWVIDKYAGAGYLLNEMKIVK